MNLEMMKQLLAEFSEKEALTTEEIKAIQQQSVELEARIQKCRAKLKTVSGDKIKIEEMRQRYAVLTNGQKRSENTVGVTRPSAPPPVQAAPVQRRAETTIPPVEELEKQKDSFANRPAPQPSAETPPPQAAAPPPQSQPVPSLERLAQSTLPPAQQPSAPPSGAPAPAANSNRQLAQFFDEMRPTSVPNTPPPAPQVPQFNSAADILNTFEHMTSSTPTLGELPLVPPTQQLILQESAPAQAPQPAAPAEPAKAEEQSEEGPDETVKSINDALRGLFR